MVLLMLCEGCSERRYGQFIVYSGWRVQAILHWQVDACCACRLYLPAVLLTLNCIARNSIEWQKCNFKSKLLVSFLFLFSVLLLVFCLTLWPVNRTLLVSSICSLCLIWLSFLFQNKYCFRAASVGKSKPPRLLL